MIQLGLCFSAASMTFAHVRVDINPDAKSVVIYCLLKNADVFLPLYNKGEITNVVCFCILKVSDSDAYLYNCFLGSSKL